MTHRLAVCNGRLQCFWRQTVSDKACRWRYFRAPIFTSSKSFQTTRRFGTVSTDGQDQTVASKEQSEKSLKASKTSKASPAKCDTMFVPHHKYPRKIFFEGKNDIDDSNHIAKVAADVAATGYTNADTAVAADAYSATGGPHSDTATIHHVNDTTSPEHRRKQIREQELATLRSGNILQPLMIRNCISFRASCITSKERIAMSTLPRGKMGTAQIDNMLSVSTSFRSQKARMVRSSDPSIRFWEQPLVRCIIITRKRDTSNRAIYRVKLKRRAREAVLRALEQSLSSDMPGRSLVPSAPMDWLILLRKGFGKMSLAAVQEAITDLLSKALQRTPAPADPWRFLEPGQSRISPHYDLLNLDENARASKPVLPPLVASLENARSSRERALARCRLWRNGRMLRSTPHGAEIAGIMDAMFESTRNSNKIISPYLEAQANDILNSNAIPAGEVHESLDEILGLVEDFQFSSINDSNENFRKKSWRL